MKGGRRPRKSLQTEGEVFRYYMPEDPPVSDECWDWRGPMGSRGYGVFWFDCREIRAHVSSQRLFNGPVRKGLEVMHSCDRPVCVNPHHLSPGTHAENMAQTALKGRAYRMPGEVHHQAKLKDSQVVEILERLRNGEMKVALAREFGVSQTTIGRIANGKSWTHIPRTGQKEKEA